MTTAELIRWFEDHGGLSSYAWTGEESVNDIKNVMDSFGLYSNTKQKQAMNNFFRGGGETTLLNDFIEPIANKNIEREVENIRSVSSSSGLQNAVKSQYKDTLKVKIALGRKRRTLYNTEIREFAKQRGQTVIEARDEFEKTL